MNPLEGNPFTCCERNDETKYLHPCSCPGLILITQSVSQTATLCGHPEYTSPYTTYTNSVGSGPPVVASQPPMRYRSKTRSMVDTEAAHKRYWVCMSDYTWVFVGYIDGEGFASTHDDDGACVTEVTSSCYSETLDPPYCALYKGTRTLELAGYDTSGSSTWTITESHTFDAATCEETETSNDTGFVYTGASPIPGCGEGESAASIGYGSGYSSDSSAVTTYSTTSININNSTTWGYESGPSHTLTTLFYSDDGDFSLGLCGAKTTVSGPAQAGEDTRTDVYTLSDPDTEADALTRADEVDGTYRSSLWSVRDTGFSFTKRTVKYAVLLMDLVKGLSYEGIVPMRSSEATEGVAREWETEPHVTFSFTATDSYEIIGGTLNSSITVDEFKEKNLSLNPSTYGLDPDEHVIIASTDLTHTQGMEYELGVNPDGDYSYIDKV